MLNRTLSKALASACLLTIGVSAQALEWSDNSIGVKLGNRFAEPGIVEPINKKIWEFVHVSGDKLGNNLLVGQFYESNRADLAAGGGQGASEFFGFYRRTFSLSKLSGQSTAFGPVKDVSLAMRFDRGTKNISFAAAARKTMAGVAFDFAVPKGYLTTTVYAYQEKNYNGIVGKEVNFDTTYRVDTNWSIPLEVGAPAHWNGGLSLIGPKGNDGFGNATKRETRLYTELLWDVGHNSGLKMGIGYELWRNKYGANQSVVSGARQNTPVLIAEYHF